MNWLPTSRLTERSDCNRYEMRGGYVDGHFAWRARLVQTDELIESSADRGYVRQQCERHAAQLVAEANVSV